MTKSKNILLIGITGKGKSTLGNVLINKDGEFKEVFEEIDSLTGGTKDIQIEEFEENGIKYQVIDTVGFLNAGLTQEEILGKITEAVYEVRDGLNQIFFVFSRVFAKEEIKAYNLLTSFFDESITKYITIVMTNFENFEDQDECQRITKLMKENSPELNSLTSGCNGILYVNNPSLRDRYP